MRRPHIPACAAPARARRRLESVLFQSVTAVKKMLSADQTCPCRKSVVILPDFIVEPLCLALNLLEVMLDYEGLLAASDVFSVLGNPFNVDNRCIYNSRQSRGRAVSLPAPWLYKVELNDL